MDKTDRDFLKISRRIGSPSIRADFLRLYDLFVKNCGEKIPYLPNKSSLTLLNDNELKLVIREKAKRLIRIADSYPVYPCIEKLNELLMKYGIR